MLAPTSNANSELDVQAILTLVTAFMAFGALAGATAFLLGVADLLLRLGIGIGFLEALAALGFAILFGGLAAALRVIIKLA